MLATTAVDVTTERVLISVPVILSARNEVEDLRVFNSSAELSVPDIALECMESALRTDCRVSHCPLHGFFPSSALAWRPNTPASLAERNLE